MQIINFFKNLKNIISQNKYAFFVLFLIILIILGSYISSIFVVTVKEGGTVKVTPTPSTTAEPLSKTYGEKYIDVATNFASKRSFSNISIPTEFTDTELSKVNFYSYVFSFNNYDIAYIQKAFSINNLQDVSPYYYRGEVESKDKFISEYTNLLNNSFNASFNIYFSYKKVNETKLSNYGNEYRKPDSPGNADLSQEVYYFYLNNSIFSGVDGVFTMAFTYPVSSDATVYTVSFPKFFPKQIEVVGKKQFTDSTYSLKPAFAETEDFTDFYINHTVTLVPTNFSVVSDSAQLVYTYDNTNNLIVPLISKKAELIGEQFVGLEKRGFVVSGY